MLQLQTVRRLLVHLAVVASLLHFCIIRGFSGSVFGPCFLLGIAILSLSLVIDVLMGLVWAFHTFFRPGEEYLLSDPDGIPMLRAMAMLLLPLGLVATAAGLLSLLGASSFWWNLLGQAGVLLFLGGWIFGSWMDPILWIGTEMLTNRLWPEAQSTGEPNGEPKCEQIQQQLF